MDVCAWFEAYLGGRWYTFDARHNRSRISRILVAHERDATALIRVTTFAPSTLDAFKVVTVEAAEELKPSRT